ncbi:DUF1343 domain-containing protein [Providencia alcalifaciens]|nr:DUF1343 domain-containing protein [Providencia rettgeri]ELR5228238.1 DUF1343 domain-containing protein [Providencia rettgeri]ELY3857969.1 DUF1343 domain-containing protein [Providencia rettgeri]MCY0801981.1 DUF1343 domain-containing protein [Providencia rettgeri]
MKRFFYFLTFFLTSAYSIFVLANNDLNQDIVLGVDREAIYGPLLKGKKVALMVNQSSVNKDERHTIDKLLSEQEKYTFKVTKLFSVEHGIRGNEDAGFGDSDHIDSQSGLPIVSLYGRDDKGRSRAHPTEEQLQDVDIVVYDLQDVGVRFFTYTISMHHLLESLQKHHKEFMVFDRPNPLGDTVYGPLLEEKFISGIGMHPIPMVHGLTSGEFALMIVNEGWLTGGDDTNWKAHDQAEHQFSADKLHIIPMANYRHNLPYHLPRVPSPNLRTYLSIKLYPSLALFEATSVNMGRGSNYPFEQLGFSSEKFYETARYTVDISQKQYGWPQAGKQVYGESLVHLDKENIKPTISYFVKWWFKFHEKGYPLSIDADKEAQYLTYQDEYFVIRPLWLAKLVGNQKLLTMLNEATEKGLTQEQTIAWIEQSWREENQAYLKLRDKYKLY